MCAWVYVRDSVSVYVNMPVCILWLYIYIYLYISLYIYVYMCFCECGWVCVCACECACICVYLLIWLNFCQKGIRTHLLAGTLRPSCRMYSPFSWVRFMVEFFKINKVQKCTKHSPREAKYLVQYHIDSLNCILSFYLYSHSYRQDSLGYQHSTMLKIIFSWLTSLTSGRFCIKSWQRCSYEYVSHFS